MKSWYELIEEQQMLADKLPMSAEYPVTQRKKHRFCTKCWFEETENTSTTAYEPVSQFLA